MTNIDTELAIKDCARCGAVFIDGIVVGRDKTWSYREMSGPGTREDGCWNCRPPETWQLFPEEGDPPLTVMPTELAKLHGDLVEVVREVRFWSCSADCVHEGCRAARATKALDAYQERAK